MKTEVIAKFKKNDVDWIWIQNQSGEHIKLNKDDWESIQRVMKGEEDVAYSEEFDGYIPESTIVFTKKDK